MEPDEEEVDLCCSCWDEPRAAGQRWGRLCFNAYMRATRPRYRDLSAEQRRRSNCRAYTNVLVKRGVLTRGNCADCGSVHVQAHHPDYSNPRLVTWLCGPCHRRRHRFTCPTVVNDSSASVPPPA